jgi:hypothetical protein
MCSLGSLLVVAAVAIALCAPAAQAQDLVSPDARPGVPTSTPARSRIRVVEVPSTRFGWSDAVIGSAATMALVLLAAGGVMTLRPGGRTSPHDRAPGTGPPS